jgi:activator of HSP90 ATPase
MTSRTHLSLNAGQVTRRWIFAAAAVLTVPPAALAEDGISRTAESIHQEPVFQASRNRVYAALTEAKQFNEIIRRSGAMQSMGLKNTAPEISREAGGSFSLFGGHILGRHIELLPSERIVQAWRVADWEAGLYSIARFELKPEGSGTRIVFDHTNFPKGDAEHLAEGWTAHYWKPLASYLSA